MDFPLSRARARSLLVAAAAALCAACADRVPTAPAPASVRPVASRASAEESRTIATLRRVTARYHHLEAAKRDGFVFLHDCEVRSEEGPVGILYVNFARLTDGAIDPELPDALIYEPAPDGGAALAGVELALPYAQWAGAEPPRFLGNAFQREDEFGVYGLHVWTWLQNPDGMFAESNPRVACGGE